MASTLVEGVASEVAGPAGGAGPDGTDAVGGPRALNGHARGRAAESRLAAPLLPQGAGRSPSANNRAGHRLGKGFDEEGGVALSLLRPATRVDEGLGPGLERAGEGGGTPRPGPLRLLSQRLSLHSSGGNSSLSSDLGGAREASVSLSTGSGLSMDRRRLSQRFDRERWIALMQCGKDAGPRAAAGHKAAGNLSAKRATCRRAPSAPAGAVGSVGRTTGQPQPLSTAPDVESGGGPPVGERQPTRAGGGRGPGGGQRSRK